MKASVAALFFVGFAHILFSLYVLIKKRFDLASRLFFLFAFWTAVWVLAMAIIISGLTTNSLYLLILDRLTYFAIPILLLSMIYYLINLTSENLWPTLKSNKFVWFLSILGLINLILIPTNLISKNPGTQPMMVGPLMPLLGAMVFFSVIYITYLCFVGWRQNQGEISRNFLYTFVGFVLTGLGGLIFNVVLPILGYSAYPAFGGISSIFIVLFMGLGAAGFYLTGSIFGIIGIIFLILIICFVFLGVIFFFIYLFSPTLHH